MDIEKTLSQLTLEEKASLCSGQDFWRLKGIERLGIPSIMVTDGPHGLRKQDGNSDHLGLNASVPATCFPTACATACSWDMDLLQEMGEALGEECLAEQVGVILGPGTNIKRSPLCGRNFEYFSEDPYLAGKASAAMIQGVQSKGVGTSLKHFAANNQEKLRMTNNSVVDERALREIYMLPFEIAVRESQPWTVMCSYNRFAGVYVSEYKRFLTDILKEEWGHTGLVVTDWGATNDRVEGLKAGQEIEMPSSGGVNDQKIVQAVQDGTLPEAVLDNAVRRILDLIFKCIANQKEDYRADLEKHHQLAIKIASESMVLLKNDGALPLDKKESIALIGAFAKKPRYQGAGSSLINPTRLDTAYDAFSKTGISFEYADGYDLSTDVFTEELALEACEIAKGKDKVVLLAGLPDAYESEGYDRTHMAIPENHSKLIQRVAAVNPNLTVVLLGGSPIEMPWLGQVKALLNSSLTGQAGGSAILNVLYGDTNPCGKLAETYPLSLSDTPCNAYYHKDPINAEYRESIYVGYRYYDAAQKDVLFPFGYGLSYTTFRYDNLRLSANTVGGHDSLTATVSITNTGDRAGAEVVQLYVHHKDPGIFKPQQELKGFAKVFLVSGETKDVSIALDQRAFAYYNASIGGWATESGVYEIRVGASSRDIRLTTSITAAATQSAPAPDYREKAPSYYNVSAEVFEKGIPVQEFEALFDGPLPLMPSDSAYDINTPIGFVMDKPAGQALVGQLQQLLSGLLGGAAPSEDDSTVRMFQAMMGDLPLRALIMFSGGAVTREMLEGTIAALNAEK